MAALSNPPLHPEGINERRRELIGRCNRRALVSCRPYTRRVAPKQSLSRARRRVRL
jgi:hypothetical protein